MGRLFPQRKPVVLHTFPMCCILFVTKKFLFTCRDQFGGKKSIRIKNRLNGARVGLLRGKGTYHSIKSFPSNPVQLHECRKFNFYGPDLPSHLFPSFAPGRALPPWLRFLGRRREKAQGKAGGEGKGERARTRREADEGSTRPARRNRRQALSLPHRGEVKRADVGGDEGGGGSLGRRGSSTRVHPAGGRAGATSIRRRARQRGEESLSPSWT